MKKLSNLVKSTQQGSGRTGITNQISCLSLELDSIIPSLCLPPSLGVVVNAFCDLAPVYLSVYLHHIAHSRRNELSVFSQKALVFMPLQMLFLQPSPHPLRITHQIPTRTSMSRHGSPGDQPRTFPSLACFLVCEKTITMIPAQLCSKVVLRLKFL